MSQALPSPPLSRSTTPQSSKSGIDLGEELEAKLDGLLAKYLEQLDQYTKLRTQLSDQFSEGFFALAKAQRASNLGAGRRYGQDGYDRRMKASRRLRICHDENVNEAGIKSVFECHKYEQMPPNLATEEGITEEAGHQEKAAASITTKASTAGEDRKNKDPAYRDPATWYSLLVPTSLRHAQKDFIQIAEDAVLNLVNAKSAMEFTEKEIRAARRLLGLADDHTEAQTVKPNDQQDSLAGIDRSLAKTKLATKS